SWGSICSATDCVTYSIRVFANEGLDVAALLQVRDLSVNIDTDEGVARVLDGVNLTIGRGEVVGLVGESGCGKTTLARTILGLLQQPQSRVERGQVLFGGADLLELSAEH